MALICSVSDCQRKDIKAHGLCGKHYQYWWLRGITEPLPHVVKKLHISERDAVWLAAIIDGEGWIGLSEMSRPPKSTAYCPVVGIGNTDKRLIDEICRICKGLGNINLSKRERPAKNLHTWTITKQSDVLNFIATIRPHLVLKGAQADLLLTLPPPNSRANKKRRSICKKIQHLNRKGRH